ncbi:MAG: Uma2 family endonuclease [Solirubrobacteraceae bacterium MAG38_C4-C5]|nr:Uma2 family endonuclease [Candidatus Siliceabacter maunaloa]
MAVPVQAPAIMTAEDLLAMPDDGMKHELVRGELRTMPPANYEHGWIASRIDRRLGNHVEEHGTGDVTTEVGFKLPGEPETVRAADVAFVVRERIEKVGRSRKFFEGAPDLAVEVVSPGDTSTEVHEKALDWLAAGTRLVLVVHPRPRTITAYRSATDIRILGEADTLDASDVVDGWTVRVAELLG